MRANLKFFQLFSVFEILKNSMFRKSKHTGGYYDFSKLSVI